MNICFTEQLLRETKGHFPTIFYLQWSITFLSYVQSGGKSYILALKICDKMKNIIFHVDVIINLYW